MIRLREKGFTSIEVVIAIMIILTLMVFSLDVLEISFKNYALQGISRNVIRTLSVQGGVTHNSTITTNELVNMIEVQLENSGMNPQNARATFNENQSTVPLNALRNQSFEVGFRETVFFRIEVDHEWHFARWVGLEQTTTFSAQKQGVSEHYRPGGEGW